MEERCIICGKSESEIDFMIPVLGERYVCNTCVLFMSTMHNSVLLGAELDEYIEEQNNKEHNEYEENWEDDCEWDDNTEDGDFETDIDDDLPFDIDDDDLFFAEIENHRTTPMEIVDELNRHVIGQEKAKKALAVAVYNHGKRIEDTTGRINKSNILILGPSGSGKTLLAQTLAKILDVPFAIADATSLTEAGYVGDDVENILVRLLMAADGDIEKAERGIIYIDEIDKIARKSENRSITRDVSGEGVQHALLKIIEGAEVTVPIGGGRKHPHGENIMINTKNILFICGGAFEGLKELQADGKKTIGFGFHIVSEDDKSKPEVEISPDLLVKYGMTPELMGRLPVIVSLHDLNEDDLVRILTEPKHALTREYQELLAADGVELEFRQNALREIARVALEKHTGARGLRSIMEELMLDIMYTAPSTNKHKYVVTRKSVLRSVTAQKVA